MRIIRSQHGNMRLVNHEATCAVEPIRRTNLELKSFSRHVIPALVDREVVKRPAFEDSGLAYSEAEKPCAAPKPNRRQRDVDHGARRSRKASLMFDHIDGE